MKHSPDSVLKRLINSRYVRLGLSLAISGVSLYLAVRSVTWNEVSDVLTQADWRWVGVGVLSVIINILSKIKRWQTITSTRHMEIGFGHLTLAFLAGQMLNSLYPARVGDFSRAYMTGDDGGKRAFMLGTIIIEKVLDVIAYASLGILMVIWMPLPTWIRSSVLGLALTSQGILIVLFVVTRLRKREVISKLIIDKLILFLQRFMNNQITRKLEDWLSRGSESLLILDDTRRLVVAVGCTVIIWGTALMNNVLIMKAFELGFDGFTSQLQASLVVLIGLIAGVSIPAIPGRIGVFEYICVLSLQIFHIPQASALSYGILLHAVIFIPQTLAGLVSLLALGLSGKKKNAISY